MRARNRWLLSLPAMSICLLSANVHAQAPAAARDLEAAKAAWQKRHERVRSLRVTLTEEMITHVGYYEMVASMVGKKENRAVPEQDVSVSYPTTVTLRDNNFKYSYTGKRWSADTRKLESFDYTGISNPDVRSFSFGNTGPDKRQTATRTNSQATTDETQLVLVPLMLAVRSGRPFHRKLADYTPTGETVAVEGRTCVELLKGSQKRSEYMYLDPQRDWVVRRIDAYEAGKLTMRLTVDYASDPVVAWLPSGWSYVVRLSNGTPSVSGKAMVGRYEINGEIADDEFIPKLAPGTFVLDDTHGRGKETVSIVRQDGSPGVALPLSQRPTDEQLLQANEQSNPRRTWRFILVGGSMLRSRAKISYRITC